MLASRCLCAPALRRSTVSARRLPGVCVAVPAARRPRLAAGDQHGETRDDEPEVTRWNEGPSAHRATPGRPTARRRPCRSSTAPVRITAVPGAVLAAGGLAGPAGGQSMRGGVAGEREGDDQRECADRGDREGERSSGHCSISSSSSGCSSPAPRDSVACAAANPSAGRPSIERAPRTGRAACRAACRPHRGTARTRRRASPAGDRGLLLWPASCRSCPTDARCRLRRRCAARCAGRR